MNGYKSKTWLALSVLTSLCVHGGALFSLHRYSFSSSFMRAPLLEPLQKEEAMLAEALQQCILNQTALRPREEPYGAASPGMEGVEEGGRIVERGLPPHTIASWERSHGDKLTPSQIEVAALPFSPTLHENLFAQIPSTRAAAPREWARERRASPVVVQAQLSEMRIPPSVSAPNMNVSLPLSMPSRAATIASTLPVARIPLMRERKEEFGEEPGLRIPHFPDLPSLRDLKTVACSDAFEVDLVFTPLEEGEGVLFALTLIPCEDTALISMHQNYLFLIDRSNSIQKERLMATQQAIARALEELSPEDTFNIFVFDSRIEKFASSSQHPTPALLAEAKAFLASIQLGSFFSQAELSLPLFLSIPSEVQEDELYTAILFTNGESLKKKDRGVSLVRDWMRHNQGRVALYTVGMNGDSSWGTMEAISALSRGQFIAHSGKRSLKRRMLKLMKSLHTPLIKQISYCGVSLSKENRIELLPGTTRAPILYRDQPYVILGRARSLDDFVLFVQGRCHDQWVNIRKPISFLSARRVGTSLKSEWALHQAHECYVAYLQSGRYEELRCAEALLLPYHKPIAFEVP